MKKTKAELLKMAEEMADDGTTTLLTAEEMNKVVLERLAVEGKKIEDAKAQTEQIKTQFEAAQAELQAIKDEKEGSAKTQQEKWQSELDKKNAAIKEWEKRLAEAESGRQKVEAQYLQEHENRTLQAVLLKQGAAKEGVGHAALVCGVELNGVISTVAENGKPRTSAIDPLLQKETDLGETVKAWLDKNPHFKGSSPSGPGSSGAGPNDPPPKPPPGITEGRSPMDAFRTANTEIAKPKGR